METADSKFSSLDFVCSLAGRRTFEESKIACLFVSLVFTKI